MLNTYRVIELALGKEEARHVDTALPQGFVNQQHPLERANNAGWWYPMQENGRRSLMGQRLTLKECWQQILDRLDKGELKARMGDQEIYAYHCATWPCFRDHVERGEIQLEEAS